MTRAPRERLTRSCSQAASRGFPRSATTRAAVLSTAVWLLAAAPAWSQQPSQAATPPAIDATASLAQFAEAVERLYSPRQELAEQSFSLIIDRLNAWEHALERYLMEVLAKSLAYRAQLRLNRGDE